MSAPRVWLRQLALEEGMMALGPGRRSGTDSSKPD